MNAATIAAIATAAVSIITAVTALIGAIRNKNTIQAHLISHKENGNAAQN